MHPQPSTQNGARAKILWALYNNGMMPIAEIAQECGLTPRQAIDNAQAAKKEGLLTAERDDVTGNRAYKITSDGRLWIQVRRQRDHAGTDDQAVDEQAIADAACHAIADESDANDTVEDESKTTTFADQALAPDQSPQLAPEHLDGMSGVAAADAMKFYLVHEPFGWQIWKELTLENLIILAKKRAEELEAEIFVYQLVKVGETRRTVEFISSLAS